MPQYIDAPKPRDFEGVQNGIISFRLGNFLKVYDVYGWPDLTGEGVTSAYQTLEMYDDWTLNSTNTTTGRMIGRARVAQIQKDTDTTYDLWIFDAQMFTALNFAAGNNSVTVGDVLKGRTSNARGFVADAGSGNWCQLEQVSGTFVNGEVIERDGRVIGTLEAAHTFNLTDTRSAYGRNSTNQIIFGCNFLLNDQAEIEASTVTIDSANNQIEGFRTKFVQDLRPGDVVTATNSTSEGENSIRIERVDPQYIKTITGNAYTGASNVIFNDLDQTVRIDNTLAKGTVADGEYGTLVRMRPFVFQKDYQNGELTIDTPRISMRSISDESFFVYRTFNNKTVVSGGVTVSLPESEQFASLDDENYVLTILGESGSAYTCLLYTSDAADE